MALSFGGSTTFTNTGLLTLAGQERSVALSGGTITLASASTLALAGGHIIGAAGTPTISVTSGANLVSLATAGLAVGDTVTHTDFVRGTVSSFTHDAFAPVNGVTLTRTITPGASPYTATFTRLASPSSVVSGPASGLLAALEKTLAQEVDHNTGYVNPDYIPLALLFANVDHQPTRGAIQGTANKLNREFTPQATGAAMVSTTRFSRLASGLFFDKMAATFLPRVPAFGDEDRARGITLWANPFTTLASWMARAAIPTLKKMWRAFPLAAPRPLMRGSSAFPGTLCGPIWMAGANTKPMPQAPA